MNKIISINRLRHLITRTIDQVMRTKGLPGVFKAIIPAAYVSGNPTLQQAHETSTTAGSKRHRVIQPFSNRTVPPVASQSVAFGVDGDNNRVIQGPIVDVSSYVIDADYVMGLRPVTPGNTSLLTASTERSTTNSTYVKAKAFFITRPGRYRLTFRLSRTGGSTQAIVKMLRPDGVYADVSATSTYSSTVYPVFGSFTLDMTITAWWGAEVSIWILNNSGPSQTGYIDTAVLKYTDATAALSPYDLALLD